jgi:hypothetical protein
MMIGAHAVRVHTCSTKKVIIMNLAWNKQNLSQTRSIHKMRETPVYRSKSRVIYQMRQTPSPERDGGINLHISACIEQRAPWSLISAAFWNGGGQKKLLTLEESQESNFHKSIVQYTDSYLSSLPDLIRRGTISPLPDLKRPRNLTPGLAWC